MLQGYQFIFILINLVIPAPYPYLEGSILQNRSWVSLDSSPIDGQLGIAGGCGHIRRMDRTSSLKVTGHLVDVVVMAFGLGLVVGGIVPLQAAASLASEGAAHHWILWQ